MKSTSPEAQLASAELSYKEDLDRTKFRGGEKPRDVLPIELLNSLDLLAECTRESHSGPGALRPVAVSALGLSGLRRHWLMTD